MKEEKEFLSDERLLFFFCAALGVFSFILTYGTDILSFSNDAWILSNVDIDIKQHYIGFLHYLNAPLKFPLGCMDSLSYPYEMSVVWTDSIPGLCVLARLFKWALPETPQLFGWIGLFIFALNGATSGLLIFRITKNRTLSLFSSLFFIFSFTVLQRLYYHTSLSAHFLILSALYWFYIERKRTFTERLIGYSVFAALCVSIHSYFLPMVGLIFFFDTLCHISFEKPVKLILPLLSFCITALLFLYIYGAFSTGVNHAGFAVGEFNSNLNTFINSLGDGITLNLKTKYYTQYEGFGYLGLGMLLLCFTAAAVLFLKALPLIKKKEFKEYLFSHKKKTFTACMFFIFILAALIPEADLGEVTLIPDIFPMAVKKLMGVFRSNGRFIWGACYIAMLSSIYVINKTFKKRYLLIIMSIALIVQAIDLSPGIRLRREHYGAEYAKLNLLDNWGPDKSTYDHIVLTFDDGDLKMNCGYFAAINKKTLNRFYFARDIDEQVNAKLEEDKKEALEGNVPERTVFIFNAETLKEWEDAPLQTQRITDDLYIGY